MTPPKEDEITDSFKVSARRLEQKIDAVIEGQAILDAVQETRREVLAAVGNLAQRLDGEKDGKTGIVARVTALENKNGIYIALITSAGALIAAGIAIALAYLK
jgi:hypothetical protein